MDEWGFEYETSASFDIKYINPSFENKTLTNKDYYGLFEVKYKNDEKWYREYLKYFISSRKLNIPYIAQDSCPICGIEKCEKLVHVCEIKLYLGKTLLLETLKDRVSMIMNTKAFGLKCINIPTSCQTIAYYLPWAKLG